MTASQIMLDAAQQHQADSHGTRKGRAEFVLRNDGSVLLILHATTDSERSQVADLDGKRARMKTVQHYGDEIWLTFFTEA